MKLTDINIRDPFVLPFEGKYYMYGSRVGTPYEKNPWGDQFGFDVYTSTDLENWSAPKCIFETNESFWGKFHFWAPEVHLYNGKFYLFASCKAPERCRGTHIFVCDTPNGTFTPVSKDPATPLDWECLDGTLYIDKKGKPHIVFCHEWLQVTDGTMCEIALSDDLSAPISAPRVLFRASDYVVSKGQTPVEGKTYVTDGPYFIRCSDQSLACIWSTYDQSYVELVAKSDNGDIDGNWSIESTPLSAEDGGHGMIFTTFEGERLFIMHKPNKCPLERPVIMKFIDDNGKLSVQP